MAVLWAERVCGGGFSSILLRWSVVRHTAEERRSGSCDQREAVLAGGRDERGEEEREEEREDRRCTCSAGERR